MIDVIILRETPSMLNLVLAFAYHVRFYPVDRDIDARGLTVPLNGGIDQLLRAIEVSAEVPPLCFRYTQFNWRTFLHHYFYSPCNFRTGIELVHISPCRSRRAHL